MGCSRYKLECPVRRPNHPSRAVLRAAASIPYSRGPASLRRAAGAQQAKQNLKSRIIGTLRGGAAETLQRGAIEEAQLELETYGTDIDYKELQGTWKMIYTTALDVRPIVQLEQFPLVPLRVGDIFQRFSGPEEGRVENIIKFSIPFLLEQGDGVTVKVGARYDIRSTRRIALTFEEAGFGNIRISPLLEALIAPALLPRGFLSHQLLLALKELQVRIPFSRPDRSVGRRSGTGDAPTNAGSNGNFGSNLTSSIPHDTSNGSILTSQPRWRNTSQGEYLLTYLDDDMLVGRQQAGAGTFIFERISRDFTPWVWR